MPHDNNSHFQHQWNRLKAIKPFAGLQIDQQSPTLNSSLMRTAISQLQLSARAYHRLLKLARTIADLAGSEAIRPSHLAEALQYRPRVLTV